MELIDDPIYFALTQARDDLVTGFANNLERIEGMREEFGDAVTDKVILDLTEEHERLLFEFDVRRNRRSAEITCPIVGRNPTLRKDKKLNTDTNTEVIKPEIVEMSPSRMRHQNRKYMWKQVRRGVKWGLIAVGTATLIGAVAHGSKDKPQPEEVK